MVDVAIAANFVRELTEEQFAEQRGNGRSGMTEQRGNGRSGMTEQRRNARRGAAEQRREDRGGAAGQPRYPSRSAATTRSVNGPGPARASARSEPTRGGRTRNETTGLRRALARFAQVRG
jgi:hypothetical protein